MRLAVGRRPRPETDPLVGFDAPIALDAAGQPLAGQTMLEWQPDAVEADKLLADRVHQPYPAADPDEAGAVLTTRAWPGAPRQEIPRARWRFARAGADGGAPVAGDTHVALEGGFQPGVIYDLVYTTRACPVVGAGLLALRDGPSFLRYAPLAGNPAGGRIEHVLGTGSSQCGRLLRNFLYLGLNADTAGRPVYDGLLINVAGARRGEFNHRYAQPSVITIPSFGYLPPFDFDGLLRRQREAGSVPRIVTTNSSSEYWNREASLVHTDAAGAADAEPPEGVRVYHFAGTKHGPGTLQPEAGEPALAPGPVQRANVVDSRPLMRALFYALDRWVTEAVDPPPSVYPRLADGTAATPDEVLRFFSDQGIPETAVPDPARLYRRRALDLGPGAAPAPGATRRASRASRTAGTSRRSTPTATSAPGSPCRTSPSRWPPTPAGAPAGRAPVAKARTSTWPARPSPSPRTRRPPAPGRPAPLDRRALPQPGGLPGARPPRGRAPRRRRLPPARGPRSGGAERRRALRRLRRDGGGDRRRVIRPPRPPCHNGDRQRLTERGPGRRARGRSPPLQGRVSGTLNGNRPQTGRHARRRWPARAALLAGAVALAWTIPATALAGVGADAGVPVAADTAAPIAADAAAARRPSRPSSPARW